MEISFRLMDQASPWVVYHNTKVRVIADLSGGLACEASPVTARWCIRSMLIQPHGSVLSKPYFDFQMSANRGIWSGIHWKF
jgi:hypothetical protein